MSNVLRSALDDLAAHFTSSIVEAIKASTLADILSGVGEPEAPPAKRAAKALPQAPLPVASPRQTTTTSTKAAPARKTAPAKKTAPKPEASTTGDRLARRSSADIEKALDLVVSLLHTTKDGLRSEQIREQLGMQREELPRILKEGLSSQRLHAKGQRRATIYSAG